jgi:hypothetical protein
VADAQYVIDVAAGMSGGDATIGELDKLTATMLSAGKNAEHFQDAIKQTGAALDVAKAASAAANEALASGAAEYALLESSANKAAHEVEKLANAGKGLSGEYARAVQKAQAASSAVSAQASVVKNLEDAANAAAAKESKLADTFKNVQKLSAHANAAIAAKAETLEKLRGGLASIPGPAGKMGSALLAPAQGFAKLSASMGTTKAASLVLAAGLAGLVLAVVAVGVAMVAGGVKVAAWAVGLADAKRSADLATEAFNAMNPALAGLPFADVAKQTGQSTDALHALAKQLEGAKVSAADMPAALKAAAIAETALGKGGSSEFIERIKEGKTAVSELAATTTSKLGGVVAKQMLSLEAQGERLKSNVSDIFGGLNIDPALSGLQKLVALFDKDSAAGQAMKFLFESIFQPLIDQADKAATVIEAFVLGFLIGMTKIYITLKPAIKAVSEFFGFKDTSLTDVLAVAKKAGEAIAPVFAVLAVIVGTTLAAAFVAIGAIIAAQIAIWYGVVKVVQFVIGIFSTLVSAIANVGSSVLTYLTGLWDQIVTFFSGKSLIEIGTQLMMGLVQGITGAISAVVQAVSNAVGAAIGAAKSVLGIASPSKVFAQIGDYAGQGFADGVEGQTNAAQAAMTDMVAPPDAPVLAPGGVASGIASPADAAGGGASAPAGGAAAAGSSGGGGGANYADMFRGAVFNFGAGADGKKAADDFVERTIELWERLAGQGGGAPA